MRLKAFRIGILSLSTTVFLAGFAQVSNDAMRITHACKSEEENCIRIGALYLDVPAHRKMRMGLNEALEDSIHESGVKACIVDLSYTSPGKGVVRLREALRNQHIDIVIGPTDSDLFARAFEEKEEFSNFEVPIISPLATADMDLDGSDWFFRTNVGVTKRSHMIYDFLRKHWIRSFAILHADTEFGRRGEEAFRKEVIREFGDSDAYFAYKYDPMLDLRDSLSEILSNRPEALGIFAERHQISAILNEIDNMEKKDSDYEPLIFTNLDARQIKDEVDHIYSVSATKPMPESEAGKGLYDDVRGLAYDTMYFVLHQCSELNAIDAKNRAVFRRNFRDYFETLMDGGVEKRGPKTEMKFSELANSSPLIVYEIEGGHWKLHEMKSDMSFLHKFWFKFDLLFKRFGTATMVINFTLIFLVAACMTVLDLSRWYDGSWQDALRSKGYILLLSLQLFVSIILFIYLALAQNLPCNNFLITMALASSPSIILRSNLVQSTKGTTWVGLIQLYDMLLQKINDRLMVERYSNLHVLVNVIAQRNYEDDLKKELHGLFSNYRTSEQQARNERELKRQLEACEESLERRKVYAAMLLKRLGWETLQDRGLIPNHLNKDEDIVGPDKRIRECVNFLIQDPARNTLLVKAIEETLENHSQYLKNKYNKIKTDEEGSRDLIYKQVSFFVWDLKATKRVLISKNLLPDEEGDSGVKARPSEPAKAGVKKERASKKIASDRLRDDTSETALARGEDSKRNH